jgi:hypothetical protein
MKTKGVPASSKPGACLKLELAKKPVQCLAYILMHVQAHSHERHHNHRFTTRLDQYLPQWRLLRVQLNSSRLADK